MQATGLDEHIARLERMRGPQLIPRVHRALVDGGEVIAEAAAFSIRDGAISGPGHIPSAPGEPPNADTHQLDISIGVDPEGARGDDLGGAGGDVSVAVVAGGPEAPYAVDQELGNSKLAERPYMRPATQENRPAVVDGVRIALSDVITGKA